MKNAKDKSGLAVIMLWFSPAASRQEAEAFKRKETGPRSQSQLMAEMGLEFSSSDSQIKKWTSETT